MKKIISISAIVLIVCLVSVLLISGSIFKAEALTEGDYTYTVSNGEATITDYNGSGGDVVIPNTLGGYPVTKIYSASYDFSGTFYNKDSITSVMIPDSVTSIGDYAFYSCNSLTSVTIGNSVTNIGKYAFRDCRKLTSVVIPSSVTSIEYGAFSLCDSLTSVVIGDSVTTVGDSAFSGCTSLTSIEVNINNMNYSSQNGVLFNKDKTMLVRYPEGKTATTYTIPDSVTTIGKVAFLDCNKLKSIELPDSVTTIGDSAFSYCTSLKSVTIPDSVTTIGAWAFFHCSSLTTVTIPDKVVFLGGLAFGDCTNLTDVKIGKNVTTIYNQAFKGCVSLTSIVIPNKVTTIGLHAFAGCTNLKSIALPVSVREIGDCAFVGTALKTGHVYYEGTESEFNSIKFDDNCDIIDSSCNDNLILCENIHYNIYPSIIVLTYDDYYNYIAENYPNYLKNPTYEQYLSTCYRHCYDVIEGYGKWETIMLAELEALVNGRDIILKTIAGSLGIGQTLEEEWLEKNSRAYAQALANVEPLLKESWENVMQSYKDFKFAIGKTEDISKATLISEISKASPCLSYKTIHDIVDTAYDDADTIGLSKIFTEADRVVDFADVVLYACQLYQVETEVLNRLLSIIPEDSSLYKGIQSLVDDLEKDPVDYVLSKYLSKVAVKEITSLLGKFEKWSAMKVFKSDITVISLVVDLSSKFLYNYVYEGEKIDELYGAIVSYDFYTTTNIAVTDIMRQIMDCNINNTVPTEKLLSDYQFIFNARLIALNQYVDSCINIAEDAGTRALLENHKKYINEEKILAFENYIDLCYSRLNLDVQNGTTECIHGIYHSVCEVPATCTKQGYNYKLCDLCNKSIEEDYKNATGIHIFDNTDDEQCNNCYFVKYVVGELDEKVGLADTDAKYLLLHTYFPEEYPVSQDCDFDGNGSVDDQDAVHLLFYTYFPTDYPLPEPPFSYVDAMAAVIKED